MCVSVCVCTCVCAYVPFVITASKFVYVHNKVDILVYEESAYFHINKSFAYILHTKHLKVCAFVGQRPCQYILGSKCCINV